MAECVCLRCHQKCLLDAEVIEGKIAGISGAACIKGDTVPDVMYHPNRLLHPLKRVGERGEGKWERISWDEATSTIAAKLNEIKEKHGPEAIHVKSGSGQKHIGNLALGIANKLFPTPNCHSGSYLCSVPAIEGGGLTVGCTLVYETYQDYAHSKCIVFWGSNPDVTTPSQVRDARSALREGAKLIVIDPRPTPMAKRADIWLRIRPGTDAALALAMLHVIINEELYDKEFAEKYCLGFDELKRHVQKYTPEWAAEVTWLAKEKIVQAATMYATTKPAALYSRLGAGSQQVNATQTVRIIVALIAVCANIDVPGGNLLYEKTWHDALFWASGQFRGSVKCPAEIEPRRIGAREYPRMHKANRCDMPLTLQAMREGKIKAVWCLCTNLVLEEPNSRDIFDILKNKVEFVFASEYFMTPTAELADIVLPAAFYPEIDFLVEAFVYPANYVTASKRVVEPLGECRDDREVAIEIARKMGMDVAPWETVRDFENWRLKYLGMTFDEVWEKPDHRITFPREFRRYERSTPPFNTPSGKVEVYSATAESLGAEALPVFKEPPESPVSTPALFKEFPLIYVNNKIASYQHTEGRQVERQRRMAPDPILEINPETALKLGIHEGDWVYLETPKSSAKGHRIRFKTQFVPELHPSVVSGAHGWWFPEKPGPEHGCFESHINALITSAPPYDPIVGVPQCRAMLCRVGKESQ